jgi:hypothetical protein
MYWGMGHEPHPDNLRASFGCELANQLGAVLVCEAQAGCSNDRIIRTTRSWIEQNQDILYDTFLVLQWTTWEREEWLHNDVYYQVNGSGIDQVPEELQTQYKEFVANIDWQEKTKQAHEDIWAFHEELESQDIKHIFFNGNNDFGPLKERHEWGASYIGPYDPKSTFNYLIQDQGIQTVAPNSWHFGKMAHSFWANFMLQYCINNKFL